MGKSDLVIRKGIAARLQILRAGRPVQQFLAEHDLIGFRWDLVEKEKQSPSLENLIRIASAFDISLDWLILGRGRRQMRDGLGSLAADHGTHYKKKSE